MDDGQRVVEAIRKCFEGVRDPRVVGRCDHLLIDILTIAILAVICGADDWTDIEVFGRVREPWLRQFLELPGGIPSHDTFRRVFELLDRNQFAAGLRAVVVRLAAAGLVVLAVVVLLVGISAPSRLQQG